MASDKLFHLIKSLTAHEKRFFKLSASRRSGSDTNDYTRLFDCLNILPEFDDERVQESFRDDSSLLSNLPALKVKLYGLILRTMREYRNSKTIEKRISEMLDDARFLAEKGLVEQSLDILENARSLAWKYEEHWVLFAILDFWKVLLYADPQRINNEKTELLIREKQLVIRLITRLTAVQAAYDRIFMLMRSNPRPGPDILIQAEAILREVNEDDDETLDSFKLRHNLLHIRALYYRLTARHEEALACEEDTLRLWEEYPHFVEYDISGYTKALSNLASLCLRLEKTGRFLELLDLLERLPVEAKADVVLKFQTLTHLRLLYFMNTGDFTTALLQLPEIEKGLADYKQALTPARLLSFHHNLSLIYLIGGNLDEAFRHNACIIEKKKLNVRRDILAFAHILSVVIQYERFERSGSGSDFTFMESLFKAAKRYLKKFDDTYRGEALFLDQIMRIDEAGRSARKKEQWQKLRSLLREYPGMLGRHELDILIESKLQDSTMDEIFRSSLRRAAATS